MFKYFKDIALILSVSAIILITVIICVCAASCSGEKLTFKTQYYFICYRIADNSVSASSLSDTALSYGGAGYILNYEQNYYVTISCYYSLNDAQSVCDSLKKRDLECSVLTIETENYPLKGYSAKQNSELYLGNLNTLNSLTKIAYECANKLDTGEYNQSTAKQICYSIKKSINALLNSNENNCFTEKLNFLKSECEAKESGYVYSKDMRYIQIAIADAVISAQLF